LIGIEAAIPLQMYLQSIISRENESMCESLIDASQRFGVEFRLNAVSRPTRRRGYRKSALAKPSRTAQMV
jgi:hypothetical protein